MGAYAKLIIEATGCTHEEAEIIEETLRDSVFHSTLDWVPRRRFFAEARKVYAKMHPEPRKSHDTTAK